VVVAVLVARVVEMSADQIVVVVAVRHGLVAAGGAVGVVGRVPTACVRGGAGHGVVRVHGERMRVDFLAIDVLEPPAVKVVFVAPMVDGHVPAVGPVLVHVGLVLVSFVGTHGAIQKVICIFT
jgi:hypothetical protein